MANERLRGFLRRLHGVVGRDDDTLSDAQLLERFVSCRDEAAFEVLVWRHGGLVFGVGCRLLQVADAEDVFQATFLTLARKARSIARSEALSSWLYKVAYRLALRVRTLRAGSSPLGNLDLPEKRSAVGQEEQHPMLHEEINRLPNLYRLPVVLCYLEGRTTEEAARQLGCARGTVCSRLAWARKRLRSRLAQRGLTISALGLAAALAPSPASGALIGASVRAAVVFTSGGVARAALRPQTVALAEGVLRAMLLSKLKTTLAVLFLVTTLGLSGSLGVARALVQQPGATASPVLVRARGDGISLPPEMVAKIGIKTAEIKKRPAIQRVLQLQGSTAIDPEHLNRVRCRFTPAVVVQIGQAEGQNDKQLLRPGDKVRKGQVLAVLSSVVVSQKKNDLLQDLVKLRQDELVLARAQKARQIVCGPEDFLLNFRRNVESDQNAVTRAENTLIHWGVPQQDIEAVRKEAAARTANSKPKPETAEEQKARLTRWAEVKLAAPEDGVLIERNVSVGEMLEDATVNLFQLATMERLKVVAQVYEADLPLLESLKPEQRRWIIRTDGADGPMGRGSFDKIGVIIYPPTRTAAVTGFVDNAEGHFRAGQLVTASITLPSGPGELVLPAAAVVEQGRQTFVFVQPDATKHFYERRRVVLLRRGQDVVHLRSRLTAEQEEQGCQTVRPGERVVTSGAVEVKAILDDLKANEDR